MMYTFYLNLVFFICYSYFHIPCLFSFIVSVSFFDFSFLFPSVFFFPPIFRPLLFFQKKTWRCSSTNKKVSKDGEQWESRNSCLHYRPRLDQYLIVSRARWRHQLECIRHARDLYTYFKPRKMLRYDTRREVVY